MKRMQSKYNLVLIMADLLRTQSHKTRYVQNSYFYQDQDF